MKASNIIKNKPYLIWYTKKLRQSFRRISYRGGDKLWRLGGLATSF